MRMRARRGLSGTVITGVVLALGAVPAQGATSAGQLTSCTFSALKQAVAQGGTIDYEQNCTDVQFASTLAIASGHTVDIEANGYTVVFDGQNARRLFTVSGGTLTITGVTLENGRVTGKNGAAGKNGAS